METPIGLLPAAHAVEAEDLDVGDEDLAELLRVDREEWKAQMPQFREHFAKFGDRLPDELREQLEGLGRRLDGGA